MKNNRLYLAFGLVLGLIVTNYGQEIWTPRSTGLTIFSLDAVAKGDALLVAVGSNGTVVTSEDGVIWQSRNSNKYQWLHSIVWGNKQFVAVGDGGTIISSPDGIKWTTRYNSSVQGLMHIIWTGKLFVAVGNGGGIFSSVDGVSWKVVQTKSSHLFSIAWNGDVFVAVGTYSDIISSTDGTLWTQPLPAGKYGYNSIIWSGTQFVAMGSEGIVATSSDGKTWVKRNAGKYRLNSVILSGNQFIAAGTGGVVLQSSDAITWNPKPTGSTSILNSIIWDGRQFVAVGMTGTILTAPLASVHVNKNSLDHLPSLLMRQSNSSLSFTPPETFQGRVTRVDLFAINGGKILNLSWFQTENELVLPISRIPRGKYLLELGNDKQKISKAFSLVK